MSVLNEHDRRSISDPAGETAQEARAVALRNRMMGEWAAGLMGLESRVAYAQAVGRPGHEPPSDEDVLRKVSQDLAGSGLSVSLSEVRARMDEFLAQARGRLENEVGDAV